MQQEEGARFDAALRELRRWGMLLETDPVLPSVATIVAGSRIRGSWWSHRHRPQAWPQRGRTPNGEVADRQLSGGLAQLHQFLRR